MNIVLVHGRAQVGKDAGALSRSWVEALIEGVEDVGGPTPTFTNVCFPFYGDLLADLVGQVDGPLPNGVAVKGADDEVLLDEIEASLIEELKDNAGFSDQEIDAFLPRDVKEKGPERWEWVQAILRRLEATKIGPFAIDRFTHDVSVYLRYPGVRRVVDDFIRGEIPSGECVWIAHSLGTVVSYNVLRSAKAPDVKAFITLGSPLGLATISRKLSEEEPLNMPPIVQAWYNAYDERDVVALRPLDAASFGIQPPVRNEVVRNPAPEPHSIEGYLRTPNVAAKIVEALGR